MRWLAAFGRRLAKTLEVHASVLQAASVPKREFSTSRAPWPSRGRKEGRVGRQREDRGASEDTRNYVIGRARPSNIPTSSRRWEA